VAHPPATPVQTAADPVGHDEKATDGAKNVATVEPQQSETARDTVQINERQRQALQRELDVQAAQLTDQRAQLADQRAELADQAAQLAARDDKIKVLWQAHAESAFKVQSRQAKEVPDGATMRNSGKPDRDGEKIHGADETPVAGQGSGAGGASGTTAASLRSPPAPLTSRWQAIFGQILLVALVGRYIKQRLSPYPSVIGWLEHWSFGESLWQLLKALLRLMGEYPVSALVSAAVAATVAFVLYSDIAMAHVVQTVGHGVR
jgi:hypothetical protein